MPAVIQPDTAQERLAAGAQPDPLDPEQLTPIGIPVAPLSHGATIQGRRCGVGWRHLGPAPRLAAPLGLRAGHAEELLHPAGRLGVWELQLAHQQIHSGSAATALIPAAALVAEPCPGAILIVEPVAVGAAAERAGLMGVAELLSGQASQAGQDCWPVTAGAV